MVMCPIRNTPILEASDIKIGEIYRNGKENYLVLKVEKKPNKIKNYIKKDIEQYGEYRTVMVDTCVCKKTTELDSKKIYFVPPSKLQYKFNQNKFNKILNITEEELIELNDAIEEKNKDYIFDKEVEFDNGYVLNLKFCENKLSIELLNNNGESVDFKKLKSIDFEQKLTLKKEKEKYSLIILESELTLNTSSNLKIIKEENIKENIQLIKNESSLELS